MPPLGTRLRSAPADTVAASSGSWLGRARGSASFLPLLLVALTLLATIDDRHVGNAADERQMIWTAVALSKTGQLYQARGHDFAYLTTDGQAVSRFGLGMTALQIPAALLAPATERALGPGASQPLFLIAPILLVLVSAAYAGVASRHLGTGPPGVRTAIVLCALGSPLGSYAATGFSETLQAAALAIGYAAALASCVAEDGRSVRRRAMMAGAAASWVVLAKSSMLLVAPAVLLPLLAFSGHASRTLRVRSATIGALPGLAAWAALEILRFGRLFGSYPGETFSNPFWDGLWRLAVGPNLGFLLFFPALAIACWAFGTRVVKREWDGALKLGGAVVPFTLLLLMAAGWWAWHGVWGWGPRLVVAAVPVLAAGASLAMAQWPTLARRSFVVVSIVINVPGLIQHPTPVANYIANLVWPKVPAEVARSFAGYAWRLESDGSYRVSPDHVLARVPQASQFVVFPWFFRATSQGDVRQVAEALERPPWARVRPDLVPTEMPVSEDFVRDVAGYPRWRFWGRGFFPRLEDAEYAAVYDEALADQVIRLQQQHDGASALHLAEELVELAPFGWNDALVLESYRILGHRAAAAEYLAGLPRERRVFPRLNVVLALFERDAGNETSARQLLGSVAGSFPPAAAVHRALSEPLAKWPPDLQSMTAIPVKMAGQ